MRMWRTDAIIAWLNRLFPPSFQYTFIRRCELPPIFFSSLEFYPDICLTSSDLLQPTITTLSAPDEWSMSFPFHDVVLVPPFKTTYVIEGAQKVSPYNRASSRNTLCIELSALSKVFCAPEVLVFPSLRFALRNWETIFGASQGQENSSFIKCIRATGKGKGDAMFVDGFLNGINRCFGAKLHISWIIIQSGTELNKRSKKGGKSQKYDWTETND